MFLLLWSTQTVENVASFKDVHQVLNTINDLSRVLVCYDLDETLAINGYDATKAQMAESALDTVKYCVDKHASFFILTGNSYVAANTVSISQDIFGKSFAALIKQSLPHSWPQDALTIIEGTFDGFCGNIVCSMDKGFAAHHIARTLSTTYKRPIDLMVLVDDQAEFIRDFCTFAQGCRPPMAAIGLKMYGGMKPGYLPTPLLKAFPSAPAAKEDCEEIVLSLPPLPKARTPLQKKQSLYVQVPLEESSSLPAPRARKKYTLHRPSMKLSLVSLDSASFSHLPFSKSSSDSDSERPLPFSRLSLASSDTETEDEMSAFRVKKERTVSFSLERVRHICAQIGIYPTPSSSSPSM